MGTTHARAYSQMRDVEIAGVVDSQLERALQLAREYGTKPYVELGTLLNEEELDVLDINVPPFLHREYVAQAARAKKHIICEKPIALSLADADAMIEATSRAGVKFMIAHSLRFVPEYSALKKVISGNELGKPLTVVASRIDEMPSWANWFSDSEQSGGAIVNIHIHDLDYLNWLFGTPESIYSTGTRSEKGSWDHVLSSIIYGGGVRAFAEGSFLMPKKYPFTQNLRVVCQEGAAEIYLRKETIFDKKGGIAKSGLTVYRPSSPPEHPALTGKGAYYDELEYFIRCVRDNQEIQTCSPGEARLALKLTLAAKKSVESGKIVHMDRDNEELLST